MLDPVALQALKGGPGRIAITGAGGWIGLATLELLAEAFGDQFEERVCCFGSNARVLKLRGGLSIEQQPLSALAQLLPQPTWVLHFAFLTKDRAEGIAESEYRAANRAIDATVLEALDIIGAEGIFVASSGAAAFTRDGNASAAMRLYGELKLAQEELFAAWATQRMKRAVITRIFNIAGPYINKHNSYALANFIGEGLAGRPIEVRASHAVVRSYVAISELMSLVFASLAASDSTVLRFDSGGVPMELADIAAAVAAALPPSKVARAPIVDGKADRYHGDGEGYATLLTSMGVKPVPLSEQIRETIAYMRAVPLGAGR